MKNLLFSISIFLLSFSVSAQKALKSDALFSDQTPVEIKLGYSNKAMNKDTNDSTFIDTTMEFLHEGKWSSINVNLRARGNFRRNECYFPPIKMKIKKDQYQGTIFDGNKTMKLVLPCKNEKDKNDNIIKEFIAYKIYEIISPYYFKTRRLEIEFNDQGKKNKKTHTL